MEQDEEVICTISKDINLISNQSLATQKDRTKFCYCQTMNIVSDSSQKKRNGRKVRKTRVKSNKYSLF